MKANHIAFKSRDMRTLWMTGLFVGSVGLSQGAWAAEESGQSVEELARAARDSVVVVMHSGRDGGQEGLGSGFVVGADGLIATSLHVIGEARPIAVRLANGQRYEATEVYAWDRKLDLAIVRIEADNLLALPLGDSDALKQGAAVVAMGNPMGLAHSIVQGVVSARRDFDGIEMIQLAIPIEEGNSGGPLLDMRGKVQGILTMKSLLTANLGFALPVNALKSMLDRPNSIPMSRWLTLGALNAAEWKPIMGSRWSQRGGRIEVRGRGSGFGGRAVCLSMQPAPEPPYELAVAVRLNDEAGAAGLVFESDGSDKHYGFYPSAGQLRLTRFDGPNVFSWTILKQVSSPHYRPGEWNWLKVRVEKENLQCFVNGHLVAESADPVLRKGSVGLAKFRDTQALFKGFAVGEKLKIPELAQSFPEIDSLLTQWGGAADFHGELMEKLVSQSESSRQALLTKARSLEEQAERMREFASRVHLRSVQDALSRLFAEPEEKIDLFYATLLISKLDNPELEIEPYQRQLDRLASEVSGTIAADSKDRVKLERLIEYLFVENGFHGSRTDYYNKANSYMNDVMDDREGLPITLSVLFLELAQRIGLRPVSGAALPKHFMVKFSPEDGEDHWVDVFDGGKILNRSEVNSMLLETAGVPLRPDLLKPAGKRDIVIRILHNLLNVARETDPGAALRYLELIVALAPENAVERLNRAVMRIQTGDRAGARNDLKWILEKEPGELDLERVRELYQSIGR